MRITLPIAMRALTMSALIVGGAALMACIAPTPEEKLEDAAQLIGQGQTARGVLRLQDIIRDHPDDPAALDARIFLARYYVGDGNAPRALENLQTVYDRTSVNEGRNLEAFQGLLTINQQLGEFDTAVALLRSHVERLPEEEADTRAYYEIQLAELLLETAGEGEDRDEERYNEGHATLVGFMLEHERPGTRGQAREILANHFRRRGQFLESNEVYEAYIETYPDDTLRTELEVAMALNVYHSGDQETGRDMFDVAVEALKAEIEEEIERDIRARRLRELATYHQRIDDMTRARELMEQVMAENIQSEIAIRTQFDIANMYIEAGLQRLDEELFEEGEKVLQQIQRENPGTNIEESAANMENRAREILEAMKQQLAAMEAEGMELPEDPAAILEGEMPALEVAPEDAEPALVEPEQ